MDKLDKLNQLVDLLQNDTITPKELEQFLVMVLDVIKKTKDSYDAVAQEHLPKIEALVASIRDERTSALSEIDTKTVAFSQTIQSKIKEIQTLIAEVKAIAVKQPAAGKDGKDGQDGQDADEERIIKEVTAKVTSAIVLPDDSGEAIVEKINDLPTDKPDYLIDAKHIKGLPSQSIISNTNKYLGNLLDVDLSGLTYTAGKYVLGSGSSSGVSSVASADGSITVTNPTSTVDLAVVKAPKLSTARTIGGVSFDGTANITVASATGGFTVSGGDLALGANNLTMTGSLGATGARLTKGWFTDLQVTNAISGSITGNAGTVTGATFTTALTVNTGTVTLTGNAANTSVLTIGAGAVSVSGSNTGDQNLFASIVVSGQTTVTPGSTSQALTLVAGTNITITTDNTAKSITITASGGSSGITVGTTTITSGTDKRILYDNAGVVGEYTLTGTGTVAVMQTSPTIVTPAITTSGTLTNDNIGAVSTDGFVLQNTQAAANNAQQWSPRLRLTGNGWATGSSASRTTDWVIENQPQQGSTPTTNLIFKSQVNNGGYSTALTLLSGSTAVVVFGAASGNYTYIQSNGQAGLTSVRHPSGRGAIFTFQDTDANLITTGGTTQVGLQVRGIASQSADLQRWQDSSNATLGNITSAGYLGIGNTSNAAPLHIGYNQNSGVLMRIENASNGASAYAGFDFYEGATHHFGFVAVSTGGSGLVGGANAIQIWNYQNGPMLFATNNVERLRILANGNIGMSSVPILSWSSSSTDPSSGRDTGLYRNAAGVVEVNNATSGQWGALKVGVRDSGTNTVTNGLTIGHQSTGTPAAGLGSAVLFNIDSTTTADQNAGQISALWTDATHATRTADIVFKNVSSAAALAETLRIRADALLIQPTTTTTAGTTGNQTINKPTGTVNIAAAGTTVTVTNSLVSATSLVFAVIRTNDATARIANVVPTAGSFTINIVACTAEVSIGFWVINT